MPGTDRVEIRTLKIGRFCVVDDEAYKILSISKSKPGKHGSAKARLSLESIFTGKKSPTLAPSPFHQRPHDHEARPPSPHRR